MIRTAQSIQTEAHAAIAELKTQLGDIQPKLLLCFASTAQDPRDLVRGLHATYPDATLWGGTTAGELCTGKMSKGSVSVMAVSREIIERTAIASIGQIQSNWELGPAFASLERQMGTALENLDPNRHVGLIISDGMSGAEENSSRPLLSKRKSPSWAVRREMISSSSRRMSFRTDPLCRSRLFCCC